MERAISIVEEAIRIYGPPVFVRHEIVHNKRVVDELKNKGAFFVKEISDIPDGGVTIFSAHGISEKVENQARLRSLPVIDATCPLVSKVHKEGQHHATKNRDVILIGHASHPEVEGTMGRIKGGVHLVTNIEDVKNLQVRDENKVAYVTQTTLSVDDTREIIAELKEKLPNIIGPDVRDICYATQNRQAAVRNIAGEVDVMQVEAVGDRRQDQDLVGGAAADFEADFFGQEDIGVEWQMATVLLGRSGGQQNQFLHADGLVHFGPGEAIVAVLALRFAHGPSLLRI